MGGVFAIPVSIFDDAWFAELPDAERPHAAALREQLTTQSVMLRRFDEDVALLKFCNDLRFGPDGQPSKDIPDALFWLSGSWSFLACRDGCIAIWEVGHALFAARRCFSRVQSLHPFADEIEIERFPRKYAGRFKDYKDLRYVAAHYAEMRQSERDLAKHSLRNESLDAFDFLPAYKKRQMHQGLAGGRIFTAVHNQRTLSLEMTEETRDRLAATINEGRQFFQDAVDRYLAR